MEVPINYLAVVGAAVSAMAIGFVWYGPLFGKQWIALMGWSEAEIQAGQEKMKKEGWKTYSLQIVGSLVMAFVFAHSLEFATSYLKIEGVRAGLEGAFWNWIGFIVPVTLGTVLWEGKSWKLWLLNSGYYLTVLVVMGLILALLK